MSVLVKIRTFLTQYPDAEWGVAHVVLSDFNLEDRFIQDALVSLQGGVQSVETLAVYNFLLELLSIPEQQRLEEEL